jgi:riboflavin biosynthesis pyrimidine reductase
MTRPKVIVHSSASIDGRIAISRDRPLLFGDERWQAIEKTGGPAPFPVFNWLKASLKPQATLEGSNSFVAEGTEPDPLPPFEGDTDALYQDYLPERVLNRPEHQGWFMAVDGRGRIRWMYKDGYPEEGWQGWHALSLVGHHTPAAYLAYLQREEIPYLVAGNGPVDLALALEKMHAKLGVSCLLVTSGGTLGGALVRAGLVDEINVEFLPAIIGGFDTPSLFAAPVLKPDEMPVRLTPISAQVQADGRVWLRYAVKP